MKILSAQLRLADYFMGKYLRVVEIKVKLLIFLFKKLEISKFALKNNF